MRVTAIKSQRTTNALLWTLQGALCLLFLFAGGMKLILPIAALTQQMHMPGLFLRFIGLLEVSCALGLVLPGILRRRTALTLLACGGIEVVMIGAVGVTLATGGGAAALAPVAIGLLAALAAFGRWRSLPRESSVRQSALRLAA